MAIPVPAPTPPEVRAQIVSLVREFVRRDVEPVAARHDEEDSYPFDLVEKMKEMGLFGISIPKSTGEWDWTTRPSPSSSRS